MVGTVYDNGARFAVDWVSLSSELEGNGNGSVVADRGPRTACLKHTKRCGIHRFIAYFYCI